MAKKTAKKEEVVEEVVEEPKVEEPKVEEPKVEEPKEELKADDKLEEGEEYHERLGMKYIRNVEKGTIRRI